MIYRAAVVLVDRKNAETRSKSVRALKAALKHGISIFIFPEGTFNETPAPLKDFFDGAFRIAIETETPIKPLLLVDTLDRLHYKSILSLTPGKNRVIYLQEIPVSGMTMKDIPALKQQVYDSMDCGSSAIPPLFHCVSLIFDGNSQLLVRRNHYTTRIT